MSTHMSDEAYGAEQAKALIGWKLIDVIVDSDEDGMDFPGLIFEKGNQLSVIWIQQDAEGNGGGFCDVKLNIRGESK